MSAHNKVTLRRSWDGALCKRQEATAAERKRKTTGAIHEPSFSSFHSASVHQMLHQKSVMSTSFFPSTFTMWCNGIYSQHPVWTRLLLSCCTKLLQSHHIVIKKISCQFVVKDEGKCLYAWIHLNLKFWFGFQTEQHFMKHLLEPHGVISKHKRVFKCFRTKGLSHASSFSIFLPGQIEETACGFNAFLTNRCFLGPSWSPRSTRDPDELIHYYKKYILQSHSAWFRALVVYSKC